MRILMAIVLMGSLALLTGCKCGKQADESAPTESLEVAPESDMPMESDPSMDQMGQDMPDQPMDEAPMEEAPMEEGSPEDGSESPE